MNRRRIGIVLAVSMAVLLAAVVAIATGVSARSVGKTHLVAYFDNSNGIFVGDEVRIMGVAVGAIDKIEPQPLSAKISFWVDDHYRIPIDAKAVILSPSLVTARAIQLTPGYTTGPTMADNSSIPQSRTAVPVEWADLQQQLTKLTETLQPIQPGGLSTLGAYINTAADNLRGEGANIHETVVKLSTVFSTLGDHSSDIFSTVKHLAALVSGLQSSTDLMRQLNTNLATVSSLLADDPGAVGSAVSDLDAASTDIRTFVADNKDVMGIASERLSALSQTLVESLDDIKQALHVTPNTQANFANIYSPVQGGVVGAFALNEFANPISFICGAIQAASRLGAEQSAKLCAQYLAPIVKNRQYNFPPLGENLIVGAIARPNEVTFSEDRLRPDHIPSGPPVTATNNAMPANPPLLPAEAPPAVPNPSGGLAALMVPPGGGS